MSNSLTDFFLALTIAATCASQASAHAPPEVLQVVSSKRTDVILSTNRGFVFGNSDTRTWSLLCNEAFGVTSSSGYQSAVTPGGRLLIGETKGLRFSDDRGCTWKRHPSLGNLQTPALTQHPTTRHRLYVSVWGFDGNDMQSGQNGVRVSEDGGDSFRIVYEAPDEEFINSLLISGGEPEHIYASLTAFDPSSFKYVVLHSADGGARWTRTDVTATEREVDVTLLAVNPKNPLELLARASGAEPSQGERLLWSRDGARTFSSPGSFRSIRSAAFSSDGAIAYVSSREGLLRATTPDRKFERAGVSALLSTVFTEEGAVLVGGYFAGEQALADGVGSASPDDASATFTAVMTFQDVRSQVQCPSPSRVAADCEPLWRDWSSEFGLDQPQQTASDGGVPVGRSDAGSRARDDEADVPIEDESTVDAGRRPRSDGSENDPYAGGARAHGRGCALAHGSGSDAAVVALLVLCTRAIRRRKIARRAS